MKVALVSLNLRRGGLEKTIVLLANELDAAGHEVKIFAVQGPVEYKELARPTLSVQVLFTRPPYFWTGLHTMGAALNAALERMGPDVVCCFGGQAVIIGFLAWRGRRFIGAQSSSGVHWAGWRPSHLLLRMLEWCAVRSGDTHIVACSESVRQAYLRHFGLPSDRISVVLNSTNVDAFSASPRMPPQRGIKLLCVGTLYDVKNFGMAIRALALLRTAGCDASLTFAGDGPDRASLQEQALTLGVSNAVHFLGSRADIPEIMRAADALWVTSRFEGFGLVIAEAMAAGLLVVGTNVSGVRDVISDGVDGLLVAFDDAAAMASVTQELLGDSEAWTRMSAAAHEKALQQYSPKRMANQYLDVFGASVPKTNKDTSTGQSDKCTH